MAINLRDHWGQQHVDEVLRRHGDKVGFDRPAQLVRAWKAGQVLPLPDGFDEIASPVMPMGRDAIRKSREEALRVIQAFMRDARGRSGVLIAGRDHYFDPIEECKKLLNLPSDTVFIEVGEFSEEQAVGFAQKSFFNTAVLCKKFFNSAILGPALRGDTFGPLPCPSTISLYDGWMFRPFSGFAEKKRRAKEGSPIVSRPAPALVCPRCPRPVLSLHLGEVDGEVVDEPPVSCDEGLGLGCLGVLHDAQAVLVGVEAHDPIIAHPELR